jgi:hypothetical protein
MGKILGKIIESNEQLHYRRLQKVLGMSNETFRKSINKLRNVKILEKNNSKRKRTPLRLKQNFKNKFPFVRIPNTYLLKGTVNSQRT